MRWALSQARLLFEEQVLTPRHKDLWSRYSDRNSFVAQLYFATTLDSNK
jgi:hypothetical protein